MMRKCGKKKLTRLVLAALLSTGGVLFSPLSVASADDITGEVDYVYNGTSSATDPMTAAPVGEQSDYDVTIKGQVNHDAYGGYSSNNSTNGNTVTIDGTVAGNVYGGQSGKVQTDPMDPATATYYDAEGNNVIIHDGASVGGPGFTGIYGGAAQVGPSNGGTAKNNNVVITGGTINSDVYGGQGFSSIGNTVTICGNAIFDSTKGLHGGIAADGGEATNNTVNILVKNLEAGYLVGGEGGSTSSGNTLNIGAVGVKTGMLNPHDDGMGGESPTTFQNMNFFLPAETVKNATMLTVTDTYNMGMDLRGVTFGAVAQAGFSLAKDDAVNLIEYKGGGEFLTDSPLNVASKETLLAEAEKINAIVPKSIVADEDYEFAITKEDKKIVATVTNVSEKKDDPENPDNPDDPTTPYPIPDRKKSAIETRAASVTLLNAGADMLASQGFAQAANAVAVEAAEQAQNNTTGAPPVSTFTPFAAFGGSSMRAESGSHVDTKGFGLNIGFARELSNSQGKLLFGPVVEYGTGNYDSYNNNMHGDGNSRYWGIGLMARQVNHDGFYYEGSLRGGNVKSDYTDRSTGLGSNYDSSSNYWAAHLGFGKIVAAGKNNTVDAYLKYFYSHQNGDDVTINPGNVRASFDAVDSHRIRVGARLTHKVNEKNSFYGGLAYQYEFGGEARAHFNGEGAPSPSVKGSSGMLELGWQVKPGGPVTLDLGVTGWAGKQRGGSVQLGATWTF